MHLVQQAGNHSGNQSGAAEDAHKNEPGTKNPKATRYGQSDTRGGLGLFLL